MRSAAIVFAALALLGRTAAADEPRAQFRLDGGQPHVGVPFNLDLLVEGFDEDPAPTLPALVVPDAIVTPMGVTPNVSRSIQFVNGRRTDFTKVTWALRWRVEAQKPGRLRVPATTVVQGTRSATAPAGEAEVGTVPIADDMKLAVELPSRPVFVGETVPVSLTWLFRRQPQDQSFTVPMLATDDFTASAPPASAGQQGRTLGIPAGAKDLQLPYAIDQVDVGGARYTRLVARLYVAPRKVGTIAIKPASVVAALPVGRADFFGNAPTRLFRTLDIARTVEVKPLPERDRPPTFAGAVGGQFAIEVRASRSVVSLGEPVELTVTVKSDQPLDTLSLGRLDGDGRLPPAFTVAADPPTGELSEEGKTKTFVIVAQVTGPATEIPALAFAYFDPTKGAYQTIHSEPIALSVKGGSLVGAGDVVSATPTKRPQAAAPDDTALVNADLALSSLGAVGDRPTGGTIVWVLVTLLYAVPLLMFAGRRWQLRTRGQREEAAEVRAARRRVEQLIDRASNQPAREIAGPLVAALRELARVQGRSLDGDPLLAKLETESFGRDAGARPLSADLRSDAAAALRARGPARTAPDRGASSAVLVGLLLVAPHADAGPREDGRAAYQQAMEVGDASARRAAFGRATIALGEAARLTPGLPELLTDWGNAALGSGDVATATVAYRRALAIDPGTPRARHNLGWLRARQSDLFRPTTASGATESLLFFHTWPRTRKLLVGASAFALAVLLLVPWTGRRRRYVTGLVVVPLAVWAAMLGSVLLAPSHADDAVVMDDVVMRAADSAGAPAALAQPVPRGAEVTVIERRDAWTRIRIANGATGWVQGGALESI